MVENVAEDRYQTMEDRYQTMKRRRAFLLLPARRSSLRRNHSSDNLAGDESRFPLCLAVSVAARYQEAGTQLSERALRAAVEDREDSTLLGDG